MKNRKATTGSGARGWFLFRRRVDRGRDGEWAEVGGELDGRGAHRGSPTSCVGHAQLVQNLCNGVAVASGAPGYGMAVAQAQYPLAEVTQLLRDRGADV